MISGVITNGSYHLAKYRKKTLNDQNRFTGIAGFTFLRVIFLNGYIVVTCRMKKPHQTKRHAR